KIPIYAVFCAAFFPKAAPFMMILLYVTGVILGILVALLLRKTAFRGQPVPFVMELPNYRMPSVKNVALLLWDKAKDFIQRAFSIIFIATVVVWFLQTFDARLNVVTDATDSLLAVIGRFISPVLRPLGFADWRVSTSLITGFTAKEAVVSTLAVLLNTSVANLTNALSTIFTPLSAFSFLIFTLLYTPCVAAVAAIRREMNSTFKMIGVVVMQCVVAWLVALIVYQLGMLF
ncbi:MAG: ferrous iron transporter B, partial [Clostridia bacterium]|nr:ferrous iron transporter B [Clostridia bacterium]